MLLLPVLLAPGRVAFGTETDQFTTPRARFFDIGPDLSRKVVDIIESNRTAISPVPASFLVDASTVDVHGYYVRAAKLQAAGATESAAIAANFTGTKFYQNLRHLVRIGETVRQPMFERIAEGWRLRLGIERDRLLRPFLSNHLDESLNPSRYRFSRGSIRSTIRNRCDLWSRFSANRLDLVAPAGKSFAVKWFGEEFGYWLPSAQEVSIATECRAVATRSGKTSIAGTF